MSLYSHNQITTARKIIKRHYDVEVVTYGDAVAECENLVRKADKGNLDDSQEFLYAKLIRAGVITQS